MWHTPSIYDNILTIHQQDEVNDLIRQAIETNDDPSTGWVMSDILEQVAQDLGRRAVPQARQYIVKEVCSIQE